MGDVAVAPQILILFVRSPDSTTSRFQLLQVLLLLADRHLNWNLSPESWKQCTGAPHT